MTTLPQTTGARFPRVGSNGRAPSIPALSGGGGAMAQSGAAGGGNGLTLNDVLRVLRTNAPLIIICLTAALVIGYVINQYVLMPYYKKYTAKAILQVETPALYDPLNTGNTAIGSQIALEVRQKTIAQKLQNPSLWQPVLANDRSDLWASTWMQSFRTPEGTRDLGAAAEAIQKNLSVSPDASTELISASLTAPDPEDARVVLKSIVGRLIEFERQNVLDSTAEERRIYSEIQRRLDTQIAGLNGQINELTGRLNAPRDRNGGSGLLVARQLELSMMVNDRGERQKELSEDAARLTAFNAEIDAGGTPSEVDTAIEMDPTVMRLTQMLDSAEAQRKIFAGTNVGPESKAYRDNDAVIAATKGQLDDRRNRLRVIKTDALRTVLTSRVASGKADLDTINARIRELEGIIAEATADQQKLATLEHQREDAETKKAKIDDRLQTIEAQQGRETARRGTVSLVYDIKKPEEISSPKLHQTLGIAALLGLGLSLGVAFLREMMDTSVRSPRDIAKVGNLNLLGMIPHSDDDPQTADGELPLAISQVPHSIISENFRQVRTRLQHAASLDTTRSLLVTSPGPGDGKTTVACNLAAGLALNGRKILLVDANFRRPALQAVFGLSNERGLSDVLTGVAPLESVTQETTVQNLSVLTTGARPANPTELLESDLLSDLIDRALEDYDHVIFDAGPILLVSETVALAPRVDGVVSVVRAKANSRGLLQRMRDTLRQLKAEHLGVVLNGVRHQTGGYYARNTKNYYAYSKSDGV